MPENTLQTYMPPLRNRQGWRTTTREALAEKLRSLYPSYNYKEEESLDVSRRWLELYEAKPWQALSRANTHHGRMSRAFFAALDMPFPRLKEHMVAILSLEPTYASFNNCPHAPIDIPDGYFTLTCRQSDGKRITFAFVGSDKGPAQCVDIQYHDAPAPKLDNHGVKLPTMHVVGFAPGPDTFDTRKMKRPTGFITVLLADDYYETPPTPLPVVAKG